MPWGTGLGKTGFAVRGLCWPVTEWLDIFSLQDVL
jgi:hypothetical protein